MIRMRRWLRLKLGWIPRPVRRVIVSVIGGTMLLLAVAGMVLPIMPGVIFLPIGLAILAVEFTWAARWLKKVKRTAQGMRDRWRGGTDNLKSQQGDSADAEVPAQGDADVSALPAGPPLSVKTPAPIIRPRPNAAA